MYTLYKFHFLNGISEINQLFDDILIIWPAPVIDKFLVLMQTIYWCIKCKKKSLNKIYILLFLFANKCQKLDIDMFCF